MNWGWSACFCLLLLVRLPASLTDFSRAAAGARQAAVRTDSGHSHPLLSSSENFKQKTPLLPENVSFPLKQRRAGGHKRPAFVIAVASCEPTESAGRRWGRWRWCTAARCSSGGRRRCWRRPRWRPPKPGTRPRAPPTCTCSTHPPPGPTTRSAPAPPIWLGCEPHIHPSHIALTSSHSHHSDEPNAIIFTQVLALSHRAQVST